MSPGVFHWRQENGLHPRSTLVAPPLPVTKSARCICIYYSLLHRPLFQVLPDWGVGGDDDEEGEDEGGIDVADGGRLSLGFRGGPCGGGTAAGPAESTSEEENHNGPSSSLEAKYFSRSFQHEQEESDDDWNHCPGNLEAEFKQGGSWVAS